MSNVGTWMQTVAVGALVTERTGRASWTALVAVAAFLPIGVLSPVGERWPTASTAAAGCWWATW